jgi:cytochrome c-type biogenesis protein CcmH
MSRIRNLPLYLAGLFTLISLALMALSVRVAFAQSPTPSDDEVNAIAKQLYCPVCESTPLDVCPTQACAQWRELIREKLAQGWTAEQIKAYFADQYGDRVLATPPARGLNWLIYLIPPIAILAGAFILYRAMKAWKQPLPAVIEIPQQTSTDEYTTRLEEELRKR